MKLRLDLLECLKDEDIAEQVELNVHRFKLEPLFSKAGVGSLSSASTSERTQEAAYSLELTKRLEPRAKASGKKYHSREITLLETFDPLRNLHWTSPFFFLNGNTFFFIGRNFALRC